MTTFALERNGSLVNHLVFRGDGQSNLYRDYDVSLLTFTTLKAAKEVADVLFANIVDYDTLNNAQLDKAA